MATDSPEDGREDDLSTALEDLKAASKSTPKNRPTQVSTITAKIASIAYANGLTPATLNALLEVITRPTYLDQASLNALIRNLYPAEKVDVEAVFQVLGCLGHGKGKPKFAVQGALAKWLICVHEVMGDEGRKALDGTYGVLFNLLDTMQLRAPLCHLLSLITRRKHVRPYRIQLLLELSRKAGHEPALVGLLRVYKDYYPDIIVGDAAAGRASVFLHPNREWSQRLAEIQEANLQRSAISSQYGQNAFKIVRRGMNGSKRGKASIVPEVRTSNALESSVTLEEISSVQDLVRKLEKIELPNQLVSVMGDPALQKLLLLKSSDATLRRVDYWLKAFFDDQSAEGDVEEEAGTRRVLEMLEAIREYVRFGKVLPPACLAYLQKELADWNGITGQAVILDLLSYLPLQPFTDLHKMTLSLLESAIMDSSPKSQITLLEFYTSLLRHWTTFPHASPSLPHLASKTTIPLIEHVNQLTLVLIANHNRPSKTGSSHPLTEPAILNYLSATTALLQCPTSTDDPSTANFPPHRIIVPHAILIYTLHFSTSLCTLSRLYSILSSYKRAFEHQTQLPPPPSSASSFPNIKYPVAYINNFNSFLMDICNCLWRDKAFNFSEVNALGCLLPKPLLIPLSAYIESLSTGVALQTLFNLSHNPVLSTFSIAYLRELEDKEMEEWKGRLRIRHAGPVTAGSLLTLAKDGGVKIGWQDYRLGVLRSLEGRGVAGVGKLMYNTMKNLMGRK